MISFLLEMGARPYHILCSRGNKKVGKFLQALLDKSPYGEGCQIWINKDLWHLHSLVMTDPVDAMIGDTHGKFVARDADIPLIRVGFPIIDRVNLHRSPYIGYQGAINLLTSIANTFLDIVDRTCEDKHFEMMR
jgi:nitrogenase molybdenum-iron protein beta chain